MEEEQRSAIRVCPFCKEEGKADATRCEYCDASIAASLRHGGTCPSCEEAIHPDAMRCRHCKTDLGSTGGAGRRMRKRLQLVGPAPLAFDAGTTAAADAPDLSACALCPPTHTGPSADGGSIVVWQFVSCDGEFCEYEAQGIG